MTTTTNAKTSDLSEAARVEERNAPSFYQLPDGWTWSRVAEERARWGIDQRCFPLVTVTGIASAWGVPLPSDDRARKRHGRGALISDF